jgi:type IV secretion system protein VirB1
VLTGMEMMSCPDLSVPAAVMRHVVEVESGFNPYAIGVVGGRLERQPQNLGEALATVHMLEAQGYNFSVGLGQVNRFNLGKYGLDSYEKAFSVCSNLSVASRILSECYISSGGDWGKSFSCYYSGDFVTGFRDGYVQKVYNSIGQTTTTGSYPVAGAIPVQLVDGRSASPAGIKGVAPSQDSAAYRVAIRSVLLDTAGTAAVSALAGRTSPLPANAPQTAPSLQDAQAQAAAAPPAAPARATPPAPDPAAAMAVASDDDVFVPRVRSLNDPAEDATPAGANATQVATLPANAATAADQADLRQGDRDDAFVF